MGTSVINHGISFFYWILGCPKFKDTHIKERPTKNTSGHLKQQSLVIIDLYYASECKWNTISWQCFSLVSSHFDHFHPTFRACFHIGRDHMESHVLNCRLAPLQEAPCVTAKFDLGTTDTVAAAARCAGRFRKANLVLCRRRRHSWTVSSNGRKSLMCV